MASERAARVMGMNRNRFKRRTGVYPEIFQEMKEEFQAWHLKKKKRGRPSALTLEEQVLMTLEFWREYRTFSHLADDWNIHESTAHRTVERVENALLQSKKFSLPGKKVLVDSQAVLEFVLLDVSEVPCERPKKKQSSWYSGKKKRHTMKMQLLVDSATHMVVSVATGKGRIHDLKLFRDSKIKIHSQTALIGDSGYQGICKDHQHSLTPHKSRKNGQLSQDGKHENRALAHFRQPVEHVIRKLKIFRVLKEVYRHRRRRFNLRVSLITGLINRMTECSNCQTRFSQEV
jgi:hypothetical protein